MYLPNIAVRLKFSVHVLLQILELLDASMTCMGTLGLVVEYPALFSTEMMTVFSLSCFEGVLGPLVIFWYPWVVIIFS